MLVYADAGYDDGSANHIQLIHPCTPVLSVPLCENDGAMMQDNVGHWNGWRGRGGQYVTERPNQTT
jgi:hypothetical protein